MLSVSIAVELDELEAKTSEYGWAYVLTVREDRTTHVVAVTPAWRDGVLVADVGRGTVANVERELSITLCFPPLDPNGFTLLVDGVASADEGVLTFEPRTAVLHRPAPRRG